MSKEYRGNSLLKRAGVTVGFTEHQRSEWIKCAQDPIYFIETYMRVVDPDGMEVPFKLYDYQKEIVRSLHENRNTIIGTARQAGKSTTTAGFIIWFSLFNKTKTSVVLANKEDTAFEVMQRIQFAYAGLPKWIQQGIVLWNKSSIILENGSRIFARATSPDSIRGKTVNFLMIDEAAHIEQWDKFYSASSETLSSGKKTKIVLISTPNGLNHFWEIWDNAQKKKNDYHWIKVTWDMIPGRNEEWKEKALSRLNGDMDKFRQEHEVEFLGSSGTLIAGWKLQQLEAATPIYDKKGLRQWQTPMKDHMYMLIADVSHGKGLDYSAFHIIDVTKTPYQQVCVYHDNVTTPLDYAEIIHRFAKAYNDAYVLVESNDIGGQVVDSIFHDYEYEHIFATEQAGRAGKAISSGFGGRKNERGIRTSKTVKALGCTMIKLLIEQDKLIIRDRATIYELSTFSKKGKSYEAEEGKHDDLVMGLVLFGWLSDQEYFKHLTEINTLATVRDFTDDQLMSELTGFGFILDGTSETEMMQDPDNDISWLFDTPGDRRERELHPEWDYEIRNGIPVPKRANKDPFFND